MRHTYCIYILLLSPHRLAKINCNIITNLPPTTSAVWLTAISTNLPLMQPHVVLQCLKALGQMNMNHSSNGMTIELNTAMCLAINKLLNTHTTTISQIPNTLLLMDKLQIPLINVSRKALLAAIEQSCTTIPPSYLADCLTVLSNYKR